MAFYVGQKVVVVRAPKDQTADSAAPGRYGLPTLEVGSIHVVRDFDSRFVSITRQRRPMLRLAGIYGDTVATTLGPVEMGYDPIGFRPVVEDTDKLAWARKLIEPSELDKARKQLEPV